jgi:lipopolysaccharide export LptBFGC system permease protein LptF
MKATYLVLALVGATLVLVPIYFQATSMDLARFTLSQYIAADTALAAWWAVVAWPFLVGASFLLAAAACSKLRPGRKATTGVLIVCLVLALLLCLVNLPFGVLAAVSLLLLVVGSLRQEPSSAS